MTKTVELAIAQNSLTEIIAGLGPDDEVLIVQNQKPIARLSVPQKRRPQFGNCKGMLTIVSEDDEHLKDFEDYME